MQTYYPALKLTFVANELDCYGLLNSGAADGFVTAQSTHDTTGAIKKMYNPDCKLKVVGEPLVYYGGGNAMMNDHHHFNSLFKNRCTSTMAEALNVGIMRLDHTGQLASLWEKNAMAFNNLECPTQDPISLSLSISDMTGLWIIYCAFVIVSIIVWAVEEIHGCFKARMPEDKVVGQLELVSPEDAQVEFKQEGNLTNNPSDIDSTRGKDYSIETVDILVKKYDRARDLVEILHKMMSDKMVDDIEIIGNVKSSLPGEQGDEARRKSYLEGKEPAQQWCFLSP